MKVDQAYFVVHYGSKGTVDRDCRETGPIFSDTEATKRGLEMKEKHGKAYISRRDRKGRIIGTFAPVAVKTAA
jgi:hypothetical protein